MTPSELEILPCKVCGVVPIPARVSKHTGIYRIRCATWDCKNNLIVEGIDCGHAVLKWNECMMKKEEGKDG